MNEQESIVCVNCGSKNRDENGKCALCHKDPTIKVKMIPANISNETNSIAKTFNKLGRLVLYASFCVILPFGGLYVIETELPSGFIMLVLYVLLGSISSLPFFALGEIIQILHDIRRKLYGIEK